MQSILVKIIIIIVGDSKKTMPSLSPFPKMFFFLTTGKYLLNEYFQITLKQILLWIKPQSSTLQSELLVALFLLLPLLWLQFMSIQCQVRTKMGKNHLNHTF